jgi:hypothetical protein
VHRVLRRAVALTAVLTVAAAGCGSTRTVTKTVTVTEPAKPPQRDLVFYGHVKSLKPASGGYELRVDPALWLGGLTAQRAAVEDKMLPPGEAVPNDYYIRDEGHRLLTYRVPADTRVTVLTNDGQIRATPITVTELADVLAGKTPSGHRLFEPKAGYWIRVALDTVRSMDQQYQP